MTAHLDPTVIGGRGDGGSQRERAARRDRDARSRRAEPPGAPALTPEEWRERQLRKAGRRKDRKYIREYVAAAEEREERRRRQRPGRSRGGDPQVDLCSEVTVTLEGRVISILPAHTPAQLRRVTRERLPITAQLRRRVALRDMGACRYCGTIDGPFELDHVTPVAWGGATSPSNLVLACRNCNQRKGAQRWRPRPLERHRRMVRELAA